MMKKAGQDLQKEKTETAAEKSQFINDNVKMVDVDSMSQRDLKALCERLHEQLVLAESDKYDLEVEVRDKDLDVRHLKVIGSSYSMFLFLNAFHFAVKCFEEFCIHITFV